MKSSIKVIKERQPKSDLLINALKWVPPCSIHNEVQDSIYVELRCLLETNLLTTENIMIHEVEWTTNLLTTENIMIHEVEWTRMN